MSMCRFYLPPMPAARTVMIALPAVVFTVFAVVGLRMAMDGRIEAALLSMAHTLETRFERAIVVEGRQITGIVVLGGSTDRAREALVLARQHPDARVILSGASLPEEDILTSAPDLEGRLTIDRLARDTFENARYSHALAKPKPHEHWLLVTSALHMPRSMGVFHAAGFTVDAWPVRDTPRHAALAAERARYEMLGLVYYRLLGRTNLLLPG